jgi:hypothetical protein
VPGETVNETPTNVFDGLIALEIVEEALREVGGESL